MLLHDAGARQEDALEYAREWALQPDERLEKLVRDHRNPSPCYQHTYWQGRELVGGHVLGDAAPATRELLTAPMITADLAASQPAK